MTENSDEQPPDREIRGIAGEDIKQGDAIVLVADGLWYRRHSVRAEQAVPFMISGSTQVEASTPARRRKARKSVAKRRAKR